MSTLYPTSIQDLDATRGTNNDKLSSPNHVTHHQTEDDTIEALQAKVGIDGSAVTTSHDYKLSEVTSSDKAVGKTATQTLTNKTLSTGTKVSLGSDATGDIYYNGGSGTLTRLAVGSNGKILKVSSNLPSWQDEATLNNASTTVAGVVEEATQAEVEARTATGGTGARLAITTTNATSVLSYDYQADSVGTDAYAITCTPAPTAYVTGMRFTFKVGTTNTDACTLNVNSLGAKTIKKYYNQDLNTGDIIANQIIEVEYDGTNFQIMSPLTGNQYTHRQAIITNAAGNTNVLYATTATTGFSSTEPFFVGVSGSTSGGLIARYIKMSNGDVVQTHNTVMTGTTNGATLSLAVIGSYVYSHSSNGGSSVLKRYDKADLANETTMTQSGTGLTANTPIYSDGTDLYNVYSFGNSRKYTISGTTATSSTTVTLTSASTSDGYWCDGTSVYAINSPTSPSATYKWPVAGSSRTTGPTYPTFQVMFAGGTQQSQAGGIIKEAGNTAYIYVLSTNTGSGLQVGGILPITSF